jgi:DNA repair exonuclease SbcCD ATPase subunit
MKWKNLFSYGDYYTELQLNQNGTIFVRGVNKDQNTSNGSGKSSIIDIFVWTLYGKPLKDIPADGVRNNHTKKGSHASVEFLVGEDIYIIERYRKHKKYGNNVRVFKNGESEFEDGTNRDAQKRIDEIIGLDYQSFISSFTFTSEVNFDFPILSAEKRRGFLEQILGLNAYSEFGKAAKSQVKLLRKTLENLEGTLTERKRFLERERDDYISYTAKHKNFDTEKEKSIVKLKENLLRVQQELDLEESYKRDSYLQKIEQINDSIKKAKDDKHSNELKLTRFVSEAKSLSSEISAIEKERDNNIKSSHKMLTKEIKALDKKIELMATACPTCDRDWDSTEVEELTKKYENDKDELSKTMKRKEKFITEDAEKELAPLLTKLEDVEEGASICRDDSALVQSRLSKLTEDLGTLEKELSDLPSKEDIDKLISQSSSLKSEISNKENETSPYGEVVDNLKNKIISLLDEIEITEKEKESIEKDLHYAAFWDESFNNDGLKMFIFESIIPVLNSRIQYYLPILCEEKDIMLQFDKYLNMDIIKDGKEIAYGALSKGERKRVDLAISLSLLETAQAQHGVTSNLMFFDEVMDSSLDEKGVKTVISVLQSMPVESIFVISHRLEISSEFDTTIDVVKEGENSFIL